MSPPPIVISLSIPLLQTSVQPALVSSAPQDARAVSKYPKPRQLATTIRHKSFMPRPGKSPPPIVIPLSIELQQFTNPKLRQQVHTFHVPTRLSKVHKLCQLALT